MTRTLTSTAACPLCASPLQEVDATTFDPYHPGYHVADHALPSRERLTVVAACTGCELVIDLRRADGVPKTSAQLLAELGRYARKETA